MDYFGTNSLGRTFILRLDQGDYVLESINELIAKENIKCGIVVSGIGTLDQCTLHMVTTTGYPPVEFFDKYDDKPLELVALQGAIADGVPHIHAVISDTKTAYAGHLENCCRILYLGEIVIQELIGLDVHRICDDKNILKMVKK